jgi:hypothetical protein
VPCPPGNQGDNNVNGSVVGAATHRWPPRGDEEDSGDFLPMYHKLDFPKFNGSSDLLA